MNCPACGSDNVKQECCGSTANQCRRCGHRFEGEASGACPLKREPPAETQSEPEYTPLTDEQLWGE